MAKFYITNAIPYVNANPHIGHALEFIQSDTIARYHRSLGDEVKYTCGSDENAVKNVQAAEKANQEVQEFVNHHADIFEEVAKKLNVQFDVFQRSSQKNHEKASQLLWELCEKNGDIYKKSYTGLYCVGCEQFYEKSELNEKGECFEHPGKPLEEVSEENYFFKLSKYQDELYELIESDEYKITPTFRKNEVLSFIKSGLQDFSISRSNARARNWGISVPNDSSQRIYVWFDALNVYQSAVGFGTDEKLYKHWWPADLHVVGKGIIRFHAVYWPAILLSAKLDLPKALFVHEYFTVDGQKMSKTIGNVIDPVSMVEKYGADVLRYYCLAKFSPFSDGDFSEEKLKTTYNSDLANGLGNLVSRVAKLCETSSYTLMASTERVSGHILNTAEFTQAMNEYRFNEALKCIWQKITDADHFLDQEKPWELLKSPTTENTQRLHSALEHLVGRIQEVAALLEPFMPETSKKIEEQFKGPKIASTTSLFPRL